MNIIINNIKKIYLLKELKNTKFFFRNPPKKKILIFDQISFNYLIDFFRLNSIKSYFQLDCRLRNLQHIYLSFEIIKKIIIYSKFLSLKQAYLLSVIETISPRVILTFNELSKDLSKISIFLKKKSITTISIQNSDRSHILYDDQKHNKINCDILLSYGEIDKNIYKKNIKNYRFIKPIGSLKLNLAKKFKKKLNKNFKKPQYDICLIAKRLTNQPDKNLTNTQKKFTKLVKFVAKFSYENRLKVLVCGKPYSENYYDLKTEKNFFNQYFKKIDFKYTSSQINKYNSYLGVFNSKIIISTNSTLLRESLGEKKKILSLCPNKYNQFLKTGIYHLQDCNYEKFSSHLKKIYNMTDTSYFSKFDSNFFMKKTNSVSYLNNLIKSLIRKNR